MTTPIRITKANDIALIELNMPPVNALGNALRNALFQALETLEADVKIKAIIISGAGRMFSAGADITEFGKPARAPILSDLCNRIEACTTPVVAAINGMALGGGLEIALAAHFRIADVTAQLGLPEIKLGLLPGAGGTQRLPRLIDADAALDMILSGTSVTGAKAKELGIVDAISEGNLQTQAKVFAQSLIDNNTAIKRSGQAIATQLSKAMRTAIFANTRERLSTTAKHLIAPHRIVDCVEAAFSSPLAKGLMMERTAFVDCAKSDASLGLRHAFAAERRTAKIPEVSRAAPRELQQIGVIGGGMMGAGIAVAALDAGLDVIMIERDSSSLARGRANVEKIYDRKLAKSRITLTQKVQIMSRYSGSISYDDLANVDVAIEAVFEDIEVKKGVFQQLDRVLRKGAILASNTSYLDINEIAGFTLRPQDVIGLHFFSPANIMPLLEIVVTDDVSDAVVATGFSLAKMMSKVPVRAGVCDGFIGNRLLSAYREIGSIMMEDGASPYEIDAAIRDFGYPIGLFQMFDLAGNDIGWAARKRQAPARDSKRRYVKVADRICENGWFGQKTGRGFYKYVDGTRVGQPDPDVLAIIKSEQVQKGIKPRDFSHQEIIRRYLAAMINEAANVLHDGTALRPSDIDVTLLNGYGFPRFRGGPMKYADTYGLDRVLADIREFEQEDPLVWQASPLLVELVGKGENFESLNAM